MENKSNEISFFVACHNGDIRTAKDLLKLAHPSSLLMTWEEGRTCFHVAVIAGDPDLLADLAAKLPVQDLIKTIRTTDKKGDTALHLAVRKNNVDLVKRLVDLDASLCECANKGETPLKLAEEVNMAKVINQHYQPSPSSPTNTQPSDEGDQHPKEERSLTKENTQNDQPVVQLGDTPLHIARYEYGDMGKLSPQTEGTKLGLPVEAERNDGGSDVLQECVVGFLEMQNPHEAHGFLEMPAWVKKGLERETGGQIALHGMERTGQSHREQQHSNLQKLWEAFGLGGSPQEGIKQQSESERRNCGTEVLDPNPLEYELYDAVGGRYDNNYCLHAHDYIMRKAIALFLVVSQSDLKVPGVDKLALNSEDKTPFEVAREVGEYHEPFRIIRKLENYSGRPKPFMYCAPQVSHTKLMKARKVVTDAYEARRNAELIVAALLAAMTCAAAFTVPGGFDLKTNVKEDRGSPILISYISFKLFLIFDCIAFFLSLFVCIMWEMSSELTTGDKMLFMTANSVVVCSSFGFTTYGFIAAVYAMLALEVDTLSWVVLGSLVSITLSGFLAYIRLSLHFVVRWARFHRLCGVSRIFDDIVEKVWCLAERCGLLEIFRSGDEVSRDLITGHAKFCWPRREKRYNTSSWSPCPATGRAQV
ncbi:hypothetical protein SUGI_0028620 [Cryptomeria japonica]|nr:hypothetical protein SUGI_0028620 [Cryptomeria japonica]